ncbi:MAG: hypothetical protein AMS27_04075 [Bacteroides sp. SM23_62_1]|nr:MAG: hypothetical protein AMS27_04075 [Bacteroides sp. SM23_62_1]
METRLLHTFHIPVMGIGYTIDTPVKVAQYGISSVISLVDDMLLDKLREFYSSKFNIPFQAITNKIEDFRAKRITSYLNLVESIVKEKFASLKNSVLEKNNDLEKYIDMLPNLSAVKQKFNQFIKESNIKSELSAWIQDNLSIGNIDVNIMTKLDKENYVKKQKLPVEYNDAHSALRGFGNSNLRSSLVLSAGMNPGLYSYIEKFNDFYPDENGELKKKITLKVSDYRSALIQGKFLAKKGLWVSEYRIESGLNCGGHAFATDGYLLGPILEKFKNDRDELVQEIYNIYYQSLKDKNRFCPESPLQVRFTAQGGVGTAEEHQFLLDYYQLDSVGWGTPFLLVPEATSVDSDTLSLLSKAREEDLYLSDISPLGIPFNTLRGNTKDIEKTALIKKGRPGSNCPKKYASLSKEFSEKGHCPSSHYYQNLKIKALHNQNLSPDDYIKKYDKIVEKSCICVGLGTASLLVNNLNTKTEGKGVSICPGPNMTNFSGPVSLTDMVDHIYGRNNIIKDANRPNMFIKELQMYIEYFKNKLNDSPTPMEEKQKKYFDNFRKNLKDGFQYYKSLFSESSNKINGIQIKILKDLALLEEEFDKLFRHDSSLNLSQSLIQD